MTFNNQMCNSRREVYRREKTISKITQDALKHRKTELDQLRSDRSYHKLCLSVLENKIEKLEKLEKLYKKEYGA